MKRIFLKLLTIFLIIEFVLRSTIFLYYAYYSSLKKPDRRFDKQAFRIICVGESTTFGNPVRGYGYPEQLEQILNKNFPYRKFRVFNLGVCAITSTEVARHFYKDIIYYKPHLAVILVGQNTNSPRLFNMSKKEGVFNHLIFYIVNKLNRLKTIKLSKFLFDIFVAYKNKELKIQRMYSDIYLQYDTTAKQRRMIFEDHQHNLEYMLKVAYKNGTKVLICNYFDSRANKFLRDFATKNNVPFCDNEKVFREWQEEKGTTSDLISQDGFHPSALGYSVMAQNLYGAIIKNNLIEKQK